MQRALPVFRPEPVVREEGALLLAHSPERSFEVLRHLAMKPPPILAEQARIGGFLGERVLEEVLALGSRAHSRTSSARSRRASARSRPSATSPSACRTR